MDIPEAWNLYLFNVSSSIYPMKHLILFNSTHTVATISFSKSTYKVAENEEAAVIEIVQSGNIETEVHWKSHISRECYW